MLRYILRPFRFVLRRAWLSLAVVLFLAAALFSGVNLWAWYHYRQAEAALRVDDMDRAREHIYACLRVWRWSAASHFLAARIERVSGNYSQADTQLIECIRLQHGASEQTQLEEVLLRAQSGELKEVELGLWGCVNQHHPESARILETLSRIYMRDSRMGAAMYALTQWLELEPDTARAWHWRGWVRERIHQQEKAIPDYEKAIALEPTRWGARLQLAHLLLETNNPDSAAPHLEELMRTHGDDLVVQVTQAKYYLIQGREEEVIELLDRLLQSYPDDFDALYLRSQAASQMDPPRDAEAERFLKRALARRPFDVRVHHAYCQCLERQGRETEARAARRHCDEMEKKANRFGNLLEKQLEKDPHNVAVLSEMGEILLDLGEEEDGLLWMRRALHEDETHERSHQVLVRYLESRGKKDEADEVRRHYAMTTGKELSASSLNN